MSDRINLQEYREKNLIAADTMRGICKMLKVEIIREGAEFYMNGWSKKYSIKTETLLDHALIEYRQTGDIKKTLQGEFIKVVFKGEDNMEDEVKNITDIIKPTDIGKFEEVRNPRNIMIAESTANKIADAGTAIMKSAGNDYEKLAQIIKAIQAIPQKNTDLLVGHRSLLEASEKGYLLTNEQVADMSGFSKSTISSKKSGWVRYGFTFEKLKENNTTLWKVAQVKYNKN